MSNPQRPSIGAESHPRLWVDRSIPTYTKPAFDAESHRRKSVDCSSPACSGITRPASYNGMRLHSRLDMNDPPTTGGGIPHQARSRAHLIFFLQLLVKAVVAALSN